MIDLRFVVLFRIAQFYFECSEVAGIKGISRSATGWQLFLRLLIFTSMITIHQDCLLCVGPGSKLWGSDSPQLIRNYKPLVKSNYNSQVVILSLEIW